MVRAPEAARTGTPSVTDQVPREQTRARYPDTTGFIERDGVHVFYEVYGSGEPTVLLLPTWTILHSRFWKLQIPDLARRSRVIAFDPRGNGRSDRPGNVDAYGQAEFAADAFAVMDATATERAVVVSLSLGAQRALILAGERPERVSGLVFIGPSVPLGAVLPERAVSFDEPLDSDDGWAKYNRHFWRRDYRAFLEFFMSKCFTEPHSTKQIEDAVAWGAETDAETLLLTHDAEFLSEDEARRLSAAIRCPTLIVQGDADAVTGPGRGYALAAAIPDARLVTIAGGGHIPNARDPVLVNLLIRDFVRSIEEAGA
jgi:pimeloyl-ACP methyl ester carboxylesterase